jgi:hypothetical protein
MRIFVKITLAVSLPAILFSCSGEQPAEDLHHGDTIKLAMDTTPETVVDEVRFKFDFAVASVPSPAQIINDFSSYGTPYNSAMLHDVKLVKHYSTEFSRACNMGIYNIDMAYAVSSGQGADVMKYLKTSLSEARTLGMKSAFDQIMTERAEANIDNKDSLLTLIDELYVRGDTYLRSNQRVQTATHIFVGSWVEALYIICTVDAGEKDEAQKAKIRSHLWDQRLYLKNIINLLGEFKDNWEDQKLISELTKIQAEINVLKDPKELDDAKFRSISEKVFALRASLIK